MTCHLKFGGLIRLGARRPRRSNRPGPGQSRPLRLNADSDSDSESDLARRRKSDVPSLPGLGVTYGFQGEARRTARAFAAAAYTGTGRPGCQPSEHESESGAAGRPGRGGGRGPPEAADWLTACMLRRPWVRPPATVTPSRDLPLAGRPAGSKSVAPG